MVKNMKAIGDNELICHKPLHKFEALDFGQQKVSPLLFQLNNLIIIIPFTLYLYM